MGLKERWGLSERNSKRACLPLARGRRNHIGLSGVFQVTGSSKFLEDSKQPLKTGLSAGCGLVSISSVIKPLLT